MNNYNKIILHDYYYNHNYHNNIICIIVLFIIGTSTVRQHLVALGMQAKIEINNL